MAMLNPELQSQPGFVSPARQVDIPNPPQPIPKMDTTPAIFGVISNFASGLAQAGARGQGGPSSASDQFRGQFLEGLQIVEGIREKQGMTAARLAEQKLASNFAAAGIDLNDYKTTYETVTGRSFDSYGQDIGALQFEAAQKDPNVQANFLAAGLILGQDSSAEERLSWAINETSAQNAAATEVARAKREGQKSWGVRGQAGYMTVLDGFTNQSLGAMLSIQQQGGRISPQQVSALRVEFDTMKTALTAPNGVDSEMFKPVGDRIAAIDNLITTLEKASSNDQVLNELSFALSNAIIEQGNGSIESVLAAAAAIKDPASAAQLTGFDFKTTLMKMSGKTILNIDNNTLSTEIADAGGTETILKELPPSLKKQVEGLTPEEHLKNIEATGVLTSMVNPTNIQNPALQGQFAENTILMGATLMDMGQNEFLSPMLLKQLVGNTGFITNLNTLVETNPEVGSNAKTILNTGLTRELVRQESNLGAIENVAGVRWDGNKYVLDQQALMSRGMSAEQALGFIGWVSRNFGGDLTNLANNTTVPLPPGMSYSPGDLKTLYQRRESIGILRDTLTKLGSTLPAEEAAVATPEPMVLGSVTLPTEVQQDTDFVREVNDTSAYLSISPDSLLRVIGFETGGTFSPSVKNPNSTATGLIQFLESTANGLGTTTKELAGMTRSQQMAYVRRYLEPFRGRMKNDGDVYMAVHWPAAVGKDDTFVMYKAGSDEYTANRGLDTNGDGIVTRGETLSRVFQGAARSGNFPGATPAPATPAVTTEQAASGEALPTPEQLAGTAGSMGTVAVETASGGAGGGSVSTGGATPSATEVVAALPEEMPTPTAEAGTTQAQGQAPVVNAEVQAAIQELSSSPDKTYASDAEFIAAQEAGELEPGDSVVVDGTLYIIRKDGTAKRIGNVNQ